MSSPSLLTILLRMPLTLKMALATVLASAVIWAILDYWQSRHLKELFQAHQLIAVEEKARENRRIFDSQIRRHHQAVKLLSAQSRLIDHLSRLQGHEGTESKIHTSLPGWLPNASMLRSVVPLKYVLLIAPDGTVREVYQGTPTPPPATLLKPSFLLQQLSHNQTLLTRLDSLPFLIASEIILDPRGTLKGTLMVAAPLDDTFIADLQGLALTYSGMVALLEGEHPRVIACNLQNHPLAGFSLQQLQSHYLVAGASLFDYGSSDLSLQLVTLVANAEFESLNRAILSAERRQRAYTAISLILTCLAVMWWIARNIRHVTRRIMEFTTDTLGAHPTPLTVKDELLILQEQFERMIDEINHGRDDLKRELQERLVVEKEMLKLSQAVEQNPAAVLITDLQGHIQYVNPQFSRLTGYGSEEALGKNAGFIKSGETSDTTYRELWETIQQGRVWQGALRNRRKNGHPYWENNIISAVRNEKGEITHYLAIKEDISPRIEMEHALQEAKNAAETANQVKNEFLANITHELRTPLNGITGITQLLAEEDLGFLNKNQKKHLKNLGECTNQLSGLINDLLDISRVDTDEFTLENRPFHLHEVVAQSVVTMTEHAKSKGLTISHQIDPATPKEFMGDAFRFRQILLNLLRNAVKFTEKGFVVLRVDHEATTANQPGNLHLSVSDTGIGIPPDKWQAIFELFTQVHGSANRQFGGSGVGLFIAKRLTELMSGRIWVESTLGVGSIFHVSIPFALPPTPSQSPPAPLPVAVENLVGMAVLIAGRNPLNRMILKKLLHNMSLQVSELDDCHEAMEQLAMVDTIIYRMVFLDCYQWESDQETIMRQLSAIPANQRIPIILVAGDTSNKLPPSVTPPGIYILGKPLNRSEAYRTIHVALAFQSQQKQDDTSA